MSETQRYIKFPGKRVITVQGHTGFCSCWPIAGISHYCDKTIAVNFFGLNMDKRMPWATMEDKSSRLYVTFCSQTGGVTGSVFFSSTHMKFQCILAHLRRLPAVLFQANENSAICVKPKDCVYSPCGPPHILLPGVTAWFTSTSCVLFPSWTHKSHTHTHQLFLTAASVSLVKR